MPTIRFDYTGAEVQWQVPPNIIGSTVQVKITGGQGGTYSPSAFSVTARLGALLQATLTVTASEILRLGVGSRGSDSPAGTQTAIPGVFYQSGAGSPNSTNNAGASSGPSGGGMSYIKRGGTTDAFRVLVAGGAAGATAGAAETSIGDGGYTLDTEATASRAATDGIADNSLGGGRPGGGGGWRGGLGGNAASNVGGEAQGGTSMAHSTQTSGVTNTPNSNAGNGYIEITYSAASLGTTTTKLYLGSNDDDGTYGTTIKQLVSTAPTANSATTNTWSSTTASAETHVPLAATTAAGDTSNSNGFAFNNAGTDSLQSQAGGKRFFRPGVWGFSNSYTLNSPALLATIACAVRANVYRVATAGGARSLLFFADSANFSATGVITWNSAAQPEIILAAGEVVEVGYVATSAATAALVVGAVTNTVLTLNLGSSSFITVPSPGIGILADTVASTSGLGMLLGKIGSFFAGIFSSTGLGTATGIVGATAGTVASATGLGTQNGVGASRFAAIATAAGTGVQTGVIGSISSGVFSSVGTSNANGLIGSFFAAVASATGVGNLIGNIGAFFSGVFNSTGLGTVSGYGSSISGTVANSHGQGVPIGKMGAVVGTVGTVNIGSGTAPPTINIRRTTNIFGD